MACPEDHVFVELVLGDSPPEAAVELEQHLDECSRCRQVVRLALATHSATRRGPTDELERGAPVGRYLVLDLLGAGGMGVVYDAYDPELARRVAIKLIAVPGATTEATRLRYLREARALARLVHPHVVGVFDVGWWGEYLFVVMEQVRGQTLRTWLGASRRGVSEVLRVFAEAAEGLSAAHAAGIVHRDFKPDNVLIGEDGHARVADFGLARLDALTPSAEADEEGPDIPAKGALPLDGEAAVPTPGSTRSIAQEGCPAEASDGRPLGSSKPLGTPAYAPPEQHRGLAVDARADQFSFCLALAEALDGRSLAARAAGAAGDPSRPRTGRPLSRRVPARVRQAITRGLAPDPAARHPSMAPILRALRPRPRGRWWAVVAALSSGLAIVLALVVAQRERASLCTGAERYLAGVWDPATRAVVGRVFTSSDRPFARAAWRSVAAALDGYARGWVDLRHEVCRATRLRGTQSDDELSLRNACLDRRLQELRALTELFARADAQVVERAVEAAASLSPLEACREGPQVATASVVTDRSQERARPAEALDLSTRLAGARALQRAGKYGEGARVAAALVESARSLGDRPLLAEAQFLRGLFLEGTGEFVEAREALLEAVLLAEASRHDELVADGWIEMTDLLGGPLDRREEAWMALKHAQAAIERVGRPPTLRARLLDSEGSLLYFEGRSLEGAARLGEAVRLEERRGLGSLLTSRLLTRQGMMLQRGGRTEEALPLLQRGLRLREEVLGPHHPFVAQAIAQVGFGQRDRGRYEDARRSFERALAIQEPALGPTSPDVGGSLLGLASVLDLQGDPQGALGLATRVLGNAQARFAPEHRNVGTVLGVVGHLQQRLGHLELARRCLHRAYRVLSQDLGVTHPGTLKVLRYLGELDLAERRFGASLERFQQVSDGLGSAMGEDHPDRAHALIGQARALLGLRRPAAARELLEAALGGGDPLRSPALEAEARQVLDQATRTGRAR